MFVPYHQQKLFDNQKYVAGATSIILLFIVRPLTAIIDIVPSAVNQEKATGELTCNLNFILIVAPVKSKLKMICLFLKYHLYSGWEN
jgi:hypothetical protein